MIFGCLPRPAAPSRASSTPHGQVRRIDQEASLDRGLIAHTLVGTDLHPGFRGPNLAGIFQYHLETESLAQSRTGLNVNRVGECSTGRQHQN